MTARRVAVPSSIRSSKNGSGTRSPSRSDAHHGRALSDRDKDPHVRSHRDLFGLDDMEFILAVRGRVAGGSSTW